MQLRPTHPLPELSINAETDLVILNEGWNAQIEGLSGRANRQRLEQPEQLRFIAVPWTLQKTHDHPAEPNDAPCRLYPTLLSGIRNLLVAYGGLDVLYVLVEPDVLRAASEQPWTETREWDETLKGDEISLGTFLAAYEEGQIRPGSFWCGWREFYEVPAEQVAHLRGLEDMAWWLEILRAQRTEREDARNMGPDAEMEPLRFRFMTWRDV